MAQSDDITTITEIMVRLHQRGGLAESIRQGRGLNASAIGKAAGVTASQITSWERGLAQPTTAQALQWMKVLHELAPDPVVAHAKSAAADTARKATEKAAKADTPAMDW